MLNNRRTWAFIIVVAVIAIVAVEMNSILFMILYHMLNYRRTVAINIVVAVVVSIVVADIYMLLLLRQIVFFLTHSFQPLTYQMLLF